MSRSTSRKTPKKSPTDVSSKLRALVSARAKQRCELCGSFTSRAHLHHRKPRQMGGSKKHTVISTACNLLRLCATDHLKLVEVERELAYQNGWLVRTGFHPGKTPVKLWDGWFLLDDDGGRTPYDPSTPIPTQPAKVGQIQ